MKFLMNRKEKMCLGRQEPLQISIFDCELKLGVD